MRGAMENENEMRREKSGRDEPKSWNSLAKVLNEKSEQEKRSLQPQLDYRNKPRKLLPGDQFVPGKIYRAELF
jgi:hypothetical protein